MNNKAVKQSIVIVKPFDKNQIAEEVAFFDAWGNSWGQDRASSQDLDNVFGIAIANQNAIAALTDRVEALEAL